MKHTKREYIKRIIELRSIAHLAADRTLNEGVDPTHYAYRRGCSALQQGLLHAMLAAQALEIIDSVWCEGYVSHEKKAMTSAGLRACLMNFWDDIYRDFNEVSVKPDALIVSDLEEAHVLIRQGFSFLVLAANEASSTA